MWCADGTPHAWCRVGAIRPPESVKPRRRMRWHFRRGSEVYFAKVWQKGLTGFFLVAAYGILGCVGMVVKQRWGDDGGEMKILGENVGRDGV